METSTPMGKMMFSLVGIFAEFERGMISERIKAGQQRSAKQAGRPTNINEGMVQAILHMKKQGLGIRRIAKTLKIGVGTIYKVIEQDVMNKLSDSMDTDLDYAK